MFLTGMMVAPCLVWAHMLNSKHSLSSRWSQCCMTSWKQPYELPMLVAATMAKASGVKRCRNARQQTELMCSSVVKWIILPAAAVHSQPTPNAIQPEPAEGGSGCNHALQSKEHNPTQEEVGVQHDAVEELQPADLLQRQLLRPTIHQPHLRTKVKCMVGRNMGFR